MHMALYTCKLMHVLLCKADNQPVFVDTGLPCLPTIEPLFQATRSEGRGGSMERSHLGTGSQFEACVDGARAGEGGMSDPGITEILVV